MRHYQWNYSIILCFFVFFWTINRNNIGSFENFVRSSEKINHSAFRQHWEYGIWGYFPNKLENIRDTTPNRTWKEPIIPSLTLSISNNDFLRIRQTLPIRPESRYLINPDNNKLPTNGFINKLQQRDLRLLPAPYRQNLTLKTLPSSRQLNQYRFL